MRYFLFFLSLVLCASLRANAHEHDHADVGGIQSLDVYAESDTLDLLVTKKDAAGLHLEHSRSSDGAKTWTSEEIRVADMSVHSPHRGTDPRVVAFGDHLLAMWSASGKSEWGTGDLQTAMSADGGRTWRAGGNPADDHSKGRTDHGYIALGADKRGVFHAVWFDPRNRKQGLRYSQSADFGKTWTRNITIDPATCQCCWNSLYAFDGSTLTVLYRALDPRDMTMRKSSDDGKTWPKVSTVGEFGWRINACPHTGGALAQTHSDKGSRLHALVWTGKPEQNGLYVLESKDDGKTWAAPRKVGGEHAQHGDLGGHGPRLVAAWDEILDHGTAIRMQFSKDEGKTWSVPTTISTGKAEASEPRVVFSRDAFQVFWTERSEAGPVRWVTKSFSP